MAEMSEIIKLLTEIVGSIKKNNEILVMNNEILATLQSKIEDLPSGGGGGGSTDFEGMGTDLKKTINDLQKGFQVMEITRALSSVRELMSYISEQPAPVPMQVSSGSSEAAPKSQAAPSASKGQPKPKKDDGHLLRPSDLFG